MTVVELVGVRVAGRRSAGRVLGVAAVVSVVCVLFGVLPGALVCWVVPVVWAAAIDARESRLPDRIVLPGLVVFVAAVVLAVPLPGFDSRLVGTVAGTAVLGGLLLVLHLLSPEGLGYGDVKFGALVGAGVGFVGSPAAGVGVFVLAAVFQLVVSWLRPWPAQRVPGVDRRAAPFGPAMAVAALSWVLLELVGGGAR